MGLFGEIVKQVLTEDKVSDYIKKLISNNTDEFFKQYLKTKVADLPENLQEHFKQAAEHSYNICIKNDFNLTQLFRLEFLNFFDLSHGKGPSKYVMGLARIAIEQIGMFHAEHDHSKLSKLKAMALFITEHPDLVPEYDGNFNGIKYIQLEDQVYPILKEYNLKNRQNLSDFETKTDYEIVPIKNFEQARQYGNYTSWCVTHEKQHFNSYTNNGQKFYFCLKEGFEDVPRVAGTNAPLDDYGLSMISVQVNTDGEPEHITTRWNHDYNGENNPGLKTPKQVQEVVGVNFYDTFKPWTEQELEELRANGDYEEDEEAKRENYDQQRWEHAVPLWDDCSLMCGYDDDFEFNENDDEYYVYDMYNDYEPVNYTAVKKETVYVDGDSKMAILKDAYRTDEFVIAVAYNGGKNQDDIEIINGITYYKIIELGGNETVICFIKKGDQRNAGAESHFGYASYHDFSWLDKEIDFGFPDIEDKDRIFVNKYVSDYIANYEAAIEVKHDDDRHSLFVITPGGNDIRTIVKSDIPTNSVMFMFDEDNEIVLGSIANYTLEGKIQSQNFEENGGEILSIEKNLDNEYFLVEVKSENKNKYNLVKKGSSKKLIPFDFANYKYEKSKAIFIPKKFNGGHNFDYESYLFDLNTNKIVSKKHVDFSYTDGTFYGGDCSTDNARDAVFFVLNRNDYMQEYGPFKKFDGTESNKVILKDMAGVCYVFDNVNFKILNKFKNYGIVNKYNKDNNPLIAVFQTFNDEIYAYRYDTLEIIDNKPIKPSYSPYVDRGLLFVKHVDNGANVIDLDTMKSLFNNDVEDIEHDKAKAFFGASDGKIFYFYNMFTSEFLPTKYGIDLSTATGPYFDEHFGNLSFQLNLGDATYVIKCECNRNFVIRYAQYTDGGRHYTPFEPINTADKALQDAVHNIFYPQQKIQVMNNFNEMLNRMNKTRNGSILL